MYFDSRAQAGDLLADVLEPKYRYENCAVVALSDGGVIVGAQIAIRLHCVLTMLPTASIILPNDNDVFAQVTLDGRLVYNPHYTDADIQELSGEYRTYLEEKRLQKIHELNTRSGSGDLINLELLKEHNVILVSDGLTSGFSLDSAIDYLKPIKVAKIIAATPVASVPSVDRMHILADQICCLSVVEEYVSTEHYYEKDDVPSHEEVIKIINNVVLNWR